MSKDKSKETALLLKSKRLERFMPDSLFIFSVVTICYFLLSACATLRRDEAVDAVLIKENALIQKVQKERSDPLIAAAISENEVLKKAEAHLSLALEEILRANESLRSEIIKIKEKEELNGQNERNDH